MYYESEDVCELHGVPPKLTLTCCDFADKKYGYSKYKMDNNKKRKEERGEEKYDANLSKKIAFK